MKKVLLAILMASGLMADFNYNTINGVWEMGSLNRTSVSFGREYQRDGYMAIEFDRRGNATVLSTGVRYFYVIQNGELIISETPPNKHGKFNRSVDVLKVVGNHLGCDKVVFAEKGMGNSFNRNGYQFCKVQEPANQFQQQPQNMNQQYRRY